MYLYVIASPPEPLDIATSNFAGAKVTRCRGYWSKSKIVKAGICVFCDGVPSTAV